MLEDDNQCERNSVLQKELLTCVKGNCSVYYLYWTGDQGDPILCCLITVLGIGLLTTINDPQIKKSD